VSGDPAHKDPSEAPRRHNAPRHKGASPEAIGVHYDVSNEFFKLWLDPEMIYSCALFEGTDDLAGAQIRRHHLAAWFLLHIFDVVDGDALEMRR